MGLIVRNCEESYAGILCCIRWVAGWVARWVAPRPTQPQTHRVDLLGLGQASHTLRPSRRPVGFRDDDGSGLDGHVDVVLEELLEQAVVTCLAVRDELLLRLRNARLPDEESRLTKFGRAD